MADHHLALPDRVRAGVAALAERAQLVRIDEAALDRLAASIDPTPPAPFPEERWIGSPEDQAMGVVAWNAVNFGSGWFPHVVKLPGHSGARTMAARWQQRCRAAALPCWDDRHLVDRIEVPLYKRAQIVVSNLAGALADDELGRFDDLAALTAFADNLVPHVLKLRGVLVVDPALDARIEREELLVSGERGEVELRAVGLHAVELLVGRLRAAGHGGVTAATVDHRLWQMGQDPVVKARPRHRCRCTHY